MNIHIVLIAYALDLTPLVYALRGDETYFHIFLHSKREDVVASCDELARHSQDDIFYYPYGTNRGLSTSWNEGIYTAMQGWAADAVLVINDDVMMTRDDMLKMAQGCVDHREAGIIEARGYNERMVERQNLQAACFGINPIALETVGYFDENFYPIYFEDSDYSRRCNLLGVTFYNVGETDIVHKGSATINSVPALQGQNQVTFPASHHYFRRKHGGSPSSETFKFPFGNPLLSWKIPAEERHDPYPGLGRTDREVVKL